MEKTIEINFSENDLNILRLDIFDNRIVGITTYNSYPHIAIHNITDAELKQIEYSIANEINRRKMLKIQAV